MSLKAFHIVFIVAAILLSLGFGIWELKAWAQVRATSDLVFGIASVLVGLGLIVYAKYVLKKLKNVSYL
jgi:hypothetical protein